EAEVAAEARLPQVGVDDADAEPDLCERDGEVRGDRGLAFLLSARARDEQRLEIGLAVEDEQAGAKALERLRVMLGGCEDPRLAAAAQAQAAPEDGERNARELRRRHEPLDLLGGLDARV